MSNQKTIGKLALIKLSLVSISGYYYLFNPMMYYSQGAKTEIYVSSKETPPNSYFFLSKVI
jgi:hypothetical protein